MSDNLSDVLASGTDAAKYLSAMGELRFNPAGIQSLAIESLEAALNGEVTFIDPTSPLVALMGVSSMNTAGFMIENEALDRRTYPNLARTKQDLYHHISDKDYLGCFAVPTRDKFTVVINLVELEARMVADPVLGGWIASIPRYSSTTVLDTTFSLLHTVHIRKMVNGGYTVSYDTSKPNPLHTLTTNVIETSVRRNSQSQQEFLMFEIEMVQVNVRAIKSAVDVSTGFNKQIQFNGQFCMARVYYRNNASASWQEMQVTMSEFVYDRSKPTAVVQVLDGVVSVRVPVIYFTERVVSGSVRVDVFSTKGAVNLNTQSLDVQDFVSVWTPLIDEDKTSGVGAWQAVEQKVVYNSTVIAGGSNELSFEELRERVIANAVGQQSLPITPPQIKAALRQDGFELVAQTDTVTDTEFLATKEMPPSFDPSLITPGNASINPIVASFAQLLAHPAVRNNGERITLVPEMLYEENNGMISLVSPAQLQTIYNNELERIAQIVSQREFLFTPFHYVLDASNDAFEARAYHLTRPSVQAGLFVGNNPTTGMNVATTGYRIEHTASGYELTLLTKGSETWRALDSSQMHVQLIAQSNPAETPTYFLGEVVSREDNGDASFLFRLGTNFDINHQNQLILTTGKLLNLNDRQTPVSLDQTFGVIFSTSAPMPSMWTPSSLDSSLGLFMLPNRIAAVAHERAMVHFGKHLRWLWTKARTISATAPYQLWEDDVVKTYPSNVYEMDASGSIIQFDEAGKPVTKLLHAKGDVERDGAGNPLFLHRKGDLKLVNGQPVPMGVAAVMRQVPIFFLEGVYFFANDYASTRYLSEMVETVVDWITDNVDRLQPSLLQTTKVYFYPKTTRGFVEVYTEAGATTAIPAAQRFSIKLSAPKAVYNNENLKDALGKASIQVLSQHLKQPTFSRSGVVSDLRKIYEDQVTSFSVSGLGGIRNLETITMASESDRCSIAKALVALPTGELAVTESVSMDWVKPKDKE